MKNCCYSFICKICCIFLILPILFQAQSDDDDVGPDDVAVNVEGRDGFMDAFFQEVTKHNCLINKFIKLRKLINICNLF